MMLESKYQAKVIKRLETEGYFVLKLMTTNKPGIPDLLALKPNEIRFVEVKAKHGVLSKIQQYRHEELRTLGFTVEVDKCDE